MYVTFKKSISDLKMIGNLIVSPDTSTVWGALVTRLSSESGSF